MNNSGLHSSVYWKDRCETLEQEFERRKNEWQAAQKLLTRVVSRLATAVDGADPLLDPLLEKIRDISKKGVQNGAIQTDLDAVSETLFRVAMEARARPKPALDDRNDSLFRFLLSYFHDAPGRSAFEALRERAARGAFADESSLFEALEASLREHATADSGRRAGKGGFLSRLFGKRGEDAEEGKIGLPPIRKNLIALLDALECPIVWQGRMSELREKLDEAQDHETLLSVFGEVIEFLVKVETDVRREQQFLEDFLSDLTKKLVDLEGRALGVHGLTLAAREDQANLHSAFSSQVENLKDTTSAATDLPQLKNMLSARLESISNFLNAAREAGMKNMREAARQVRELSERAQALDAETKDLRAKLRLEHNLAMRDALTGLPNRLAYEERLAQEVSRLKRFRQPFCLLIWDIDRFKSVNDRFGHKAGDRALSTIAQIFAKSVRETDFVGRFGGEEFVMILAGTEHDAALKVAENIRRKAGGADFDFQGKKVRITLSCGLTSYRETDEPDHAFERADQALYQAKRQGRDRCVLA
jgi:diguanylate cyclase